MKRNKGITLIVLIITIIIMIILLTVSAKVVIDTDILDMAQEAGEDYNQSQELEKDLNANKITMNNTALDKYVQKVCSHTFGTDNKCKICGVTQITFIVKNINNADSAISLNAIEGMTWAEFAKSKYCPKGIFLGQMYDEEGQVIGMTDVTSDLANVIATELVCVSDGAVQIYPLDTNDNYSGDDVLWGDLIIDGDSYGYNN